ncbi:MAG: hypothetical protein AB1765_04130, partial [Candidatus Hydrogenedentota bacterium]
MNELISLMEKAKRISERFERMLFVLGIITKGLCTKGLKPILIGGCALEFYTYGGYNTMDIDIALPEDEYYNELMKTLGFKKEGR